MADFLIECNKMKVGEQNGTEVRLEVNGLTGLELANALQATLQALIGSDQTRQAFMIALEAFVKNEEK